MNHKKEELQKLLEKNISQREAFAFFDSLEPINITGMVGIWKGQELKTGHPMEGILEAANWYGKVFEDKDHVFPLVFETSSHKLYAGNPGKIYFKNLQKNLSPKAVSVLFPIISPFIKTKKSKARLRMMNYRGKTTAAMFYDQLAIIDVFRKVDDDTVMGIMDCKHDSSDKSFFFILEKQETINKIEIVH